MIQHSRKPAAVILLLMLGLSTLLVLDRRTLARGADDTELAALQLAIAQPDAKTQTWLKYAQKLQAVGQPRHAAMAYRRVLAAEPYNRIARLNGAICLAKAGQADDFYTFMHDTVLIDPKLAVDVFERPEAQAFLSEPRFQALSREAQVQSMD